MLSYLRMFGYVTTILLHCINILSLMLVDVDKITDKDAQLFGSLQYRYFTCWTFGLQVIHAFLGILCEILIVSNFKNKNYKLPKLLRGTRNFLFSAIVFPSTVLVFTIFWTLFLYDRELILPQYMDQILTPTNNHIMHTAIVPIVLWEIMFQPRIELKTHTRNITQLTCHLLVYGSVLLYTYYEQGVWLYPIVGLLYGTIYFYLSILSLLFLSILFYYLQWKLVRMVWKDNITELKQKIH